MKKLKFISNYLPEMKEAKGRNIEKMVGCVQVPLGLAGPLLGKYIPIATTEGALVASVDRGCRAIGKAERFEVGVKETGITRGPVFRVKGIREAEKLVYWVEENLEWLKKITTKTEKHLKLVRVKNKIVGKNVWLRLEFDASEAMGMNMATMASEKIVEVIEKKLKVEGVSLSGNYCVDKKPSWLNFIEGRGKQVWAEAVLSRKTVKEILKTTPEKIVEVVYRKQLLGSAVSGSMGFNAHYANVVAGVFLATGQDMAHVVEGSLGMTTAEIETSSFFDNHSLASIDSLSFPAKANYLHTRSNFSILSKPSKLHLRKLAAKKIVNKPDLYFSIYLPSLLVGTVGGGTHLATQKEALKVMGLSNKKGDAVKLAEIIGGAVLAGELSLTAALASKDLAKAHQKLGRQ